MGFRYTFIFIKKLAIFKPLNVLHFKMSDQYLTESERLVLMKEYINCYMKSVDVVDCFSLFSENEKSEKMILEMFHDHYHCQKASSLKLLQSYILAKANRAQQVSHFLEIENVNNKNNNIDISSIPMDIDQVKNRDSFTKSQHNENIITSPNENIPQSQIAKKINPFIGDGYKSIRNIKPDAAKIQRQWMMRVKMNKRTNNGSGSNNDALNVMTIGNYFQLNLDNVNTSSIISEDKLYNLQTLIDRKIVSTRHQGIAQDHHKFCSNPHLFGLTSDYYLQSNGELRALFEVDLNQSEEAIRQGICLAILELGENFHELFMLPLNNISITDRNVLAGIVAVWRLHGREKALSIGSDLEDEDEPKVAQICRDLVNSFGLESVLEGSFPRKSSEELESRVFSMEKSKV